MIKADYANAENTAVVVTEELRGAARAMLVAGTITP